jgi:hypothetical protein
MGDYQSYTAAATGRKGRTKTLRQQRIDAGLCCRCGLFPAEAKRRQCRQCRMKHREYERQAAQRKRETAKDRAVGSYVDAAGVQDVPVVRGTQWYWSFRNDMPTIFEPEVHG